MTQETAIRIQNLNCDGCTSCGNCTSNRIKMNIMSYTGVERVRINHKEDEVVISHSTPIDLNGITETLTEMGFPGSVN